MDTLSLSGRRRWALAFQFVCFALDPRFQGHQAFCFSAYETQLNVYLFADLMFFSSLLEVAATETPGQSFGESMKATDKRMTAERWSSL